MKWLILTIFLFNIKPSQAQENCFEGKIKTITIGNGKESLPFEQIWKIDQNSIAILHPVDKDKDIVFDIQEKKCAWSEDLSTGESSYLVIQNENGKKAVFKVIITKERKVLELLYEGSKELRVFEIEDK